jgi:hypothetical protein
MGPGARSMAPTSEAGKGVLRPLGAVGGQRFEIVLVDLRPQVDFNRGTESAMPPMTTASIWCPRRISNARSAASVVT